MRVSIEPQFVVCTAPKRRDGDSVEILFAAASDMGEADGMQSDISTITDQLEDGPYDLSAGHEINLADHPPVGRPNWRSKQLEFTETSNVLWSLVGVGLHKVEISGGGGGLSGSGKVAMDLYKKVFKFVLGKVGPQGSAIALVMDFVEAVAATGPVDHCLGALFAFKLQYSGADLAFNLIKSGGTIRLNLGPSDSIPFQIGSSCQRPAYSAAVVIRLHDRVGFSMNTDTIEKSRGRPVALTNLMESCRQPNAVQIWSVSRETTIRLDPAVEFVSLKHVWSIDGQPLDPTGSHVTFSAHVTRYDPAREYAPKSQQESVTLEYRIDPRGALKVVSPSTSGNFEFYLACDLHDNKGNSHRIFGGSRVRVESEIVDGNDAYRKYVECVREYWAAAEHAVRRLADTLRFRPIAIPHFDPAPGIREMTKTLDEIQGLVKALSARIGGPIR